MLIPIRSIYRVYFFLFLRIPPPPRSTLFPYTTLFRSDRRRPGAAHRFLRSERRTSARSVASRTPVLVRADDPSAHADVSHGALRVRRVSLEPGRGCRSEEHTSELQSLTNLVCRLLLEK